MKKGNKVKLFATGKVILKRQLLFVFETTVKIFQEVMKWDFALLILLCFVSK